MHRRGLSAFAGNAAAAKPAATLSKSEIPSGFAVGSGTPPLALKVELDAGQVKSATVADVASANLTASGQLDAGEATLSISHALDVTLKFDLYISDDGERFVYTSSCAVTPGISSFELWQQPVRAFALGNPRVVDKNRLTCE